MDKNDILEFLKSKFDNDVQLIVFDNYNNIKLKCVKHDIEYCSSLSNLKKRKTCCIKRSYELRGINKRLTKQNFVDKANKIFGKDRYNYSEFEYVNNKVHGLIICNECKNEFMMRPDVHLFNKSGCKICNKPNIYTRAYYESHNIENHDVYLYFIEFKKSEGHFVKIGFTKHKRIQYIFRGENYKPLKIDSFKIDFFSAYDIEQQILKEFVDFKYVPIEPFKGSTECFVFDKYEEILSRIKELVRLRSDSQDETALIAGKGLSL